MILRDILIAFGWSLILSSIILQALYTRPMLCEMDILLIFVASFLAGLMFRELATAVLCWFCSIFICVALMTLCLNTPVFLGISRFAPLIEYSSILMIFRGVFPLPLISSLFGCLVGNVVREKLVTFSGEA